ncbi:MAG: hypothetical protein COU09_03060 [Candidatus Harrisonbacteria bacterium CG10_big_fil_rev_8_21_14_0_10_44_23]|uniref:Uncharacterized protein n=1 Tax=Candidatus Harrisonbacteria bacterium CG10_big_fil_rev_8_21_14_0_10_44_23 TaxID=1974585 RepID=A0A2H0UPE4_9BACT|nr:MAG: hypothetical protein COU09_03060 [Candidatus Harrisonbacteria bacterium CG10_big_fil_rev_8_21_14_0_10_44_23]
MTYRIIKQIIYGIFYLLLLVGILFAVYLYLIQPEPTCFDRSQNQGEEGVDCGGPCESCAIRELDPIRVLPGVLLSVPGGGSSFIVQFRNSNATHAAKEFLYTINFYGSQDELISTIEEQSFIYAGEVKFITHPNLKINPDRIKRSEVLISNIDWVLRDEFPKPGIQARQTKLEVSTAKSDRDEVIITGVLSNNNSFILQQASIHARVSDRIGGLVAASKTLLEDIPAFSEKEFSIIMPISPGLADNELQFDLYLEPLQ